MRPQVALCISPITGSAAPVIPLIRGREAREAASFRALVRSVDCPTCTARAGHKCINALTGVEYLDRVPGHIARVRAAQARP